jgi:hypothetical protein
VAGEQGEGKVATITFRALSAGNTTLTFADPHVVESTGEFLAGWPFYAAQLGKSAIYISP